MFYFAFENEKYSDFGQKPGIFHIFVEITFSLVLIFYIYLSAILNCEFLILAKTKKYEKLEKIDEIEI